MARIAKFEVFCVDLPFRRPFRHAAAERASSASVFVKCATDTGREGFGECLPREYVTGESREGAFEMLRGLFLPRLLGAEFNSVAEVKSFLGRCDGSPPAAWGPADPPHASAWCAVDLALLDAFGREFGEAVRLGGAAFPHKVRYSPVVSVEPGVGFIKTLLKIRLFGIRQVKLKVGREADARAVRIARRILGRECDIRVDANMAWSVGEALRAMRALSNLGVRSFEQPVAADDIEGLARIVRESRLGVMADESISDRASLERLVAKRACTSVNVRISKCGGLMAAFNRCREARAAGLGIQVGCQVGESSLLSAAHMILVGAVGDVAYAEGCFGLLLLREDPFEPVLQFGRGGLPPALPTGPGLGGTVREDVMRRWTVMHDIIK